MYLQEPQRNPKMQCGDMTNRLHTTRAKSQILIYEERPPEDFVRRNLPTTQAVTTRKGFTKNCHLAIYHLSKKAWKIFLFAYAPQLALSQKTLGYGLIPENVDIFLQLVLTTTQILVRILFDGCTFDQGPFIKDVGIFLAVFDTQLPHVGIWTLIYLTSTF